MSKDKSFPRHSVMLRRAIVAILTVGLCTLVVSSTFFLKRRFRDEMVESKLEKLASALACYSLANNSLPPQAVLDSKGQPLYSWRCMILPYLELRPLLQKLDMSRPWNTARNREAIIPLSEFSDGDTSEPLTSFVAVTGKGTLWESLRLASDKPDFDPEKRIAVVLYHNSNICWAEPKDIELVDLLDAVKNNKIRDLLGTEKIIGVTLGGKVCEIDPIEGVDSIGAMFAR